MSFVEDMATFYDAALTETVSTPSGSFPAFLDIAERDAFGASRISTHFLRYQAETVLAANDLLTIAAGPHAGDYKVIGQPLQINGDECQAELVKQ